MRTRGWFFAMALGVLPGAVAGQAIERGFSRPGLLLERTGWGRSNERAMSAALSDARLAPAGIEWFNWAARSVARQLDSLIEAGADVIMLVANAPEGQVVNSTHPAQIYYNSNSVQEIHFSCQPTVPTTTA